MNPGFYPALAAEAMAIAGEVEEMDLNTAMDRSVHWSRKGESRSFRERSGCYFSVRIEVLFPHLDHGFSASPRAKQIVDAMRAKVSRNSNSPRPPREKGAESATQTRPVPEMRAVLPEASKAEQEKN